jgi:hypothetical protein
MPFQTYQQLQDELVRWLGERTDLIPQIPAFIALAEEAISGDLRCREQHDRALALLTEEFEFLPANFAVVDYVRFGSGNGDKVRLPYRTMQQIDALGLSGQQTDAPCAFSIVGAQIRFAPAPTPFTVPDGVDPDLEPQKCRHFEIVYWTRVAPLGPDPAGANVVLLTYPGIYLFGSLCAAEPYMANDQRVPLWKAQYGEAVDRANTLDKAGTLATMAISAPGNTP